jgi:hypothetical protein
MKMLYLPLESIILFLTSRMEVNRLKFILHQLKHIENRIPEEKSNQSFTKNLQDFLNSFSFPEMKQEKETPVVLVDVAPEEYKMVVEEPKKEKKKKEKDEPKPTKNTKTKSPKTPKNKLKLTTSSPTVAVPVIVVDPTLTSHCEAPLTPKTEIIEKQKVKTKSTPILKDTDRESQPIEVSKNILTELIDKKEPIPSPEPSKKRKRENEKTTPQKKKKEKFEKEQAPVEPDPVSEVMENKEEVDSMVEEPVIEEIKKTPRQRGRKKKEVKVEQVDEIIIPEPTVTPSLDEKKKRGRKKKTETPPPVVIPPTKIEKKSPSPVKEKKENLSNEKSKEIHILLSETLSKLEENIDLMEIFLYPVSNEVAELYDQIIKHPMSLSDIKSSIEMKKLSSISELKQKLWLMFANALIYNPPTHHVHKITIKIKNEVENVLEEAKVKESKILKI